MLTGGCYCRYVRYETAATPFHRSHCHCSICRRVSAAPFVTWFSVPAGTLHFVAGEPARFASSEVATRTFCPRCGTPLTFEHTQYTDEIGVTTCSLDEPERVPPDDHIHVTSQLPWIALGDGLPRYPGERTE